MPLLGIPGPRTARWRPILLHETGIQTEAIVADLISESCANIFLATTGAPCAKPQQPHRKRTWHPHHLTKGFGTFEPQARGSSNGLTKNIKTFNLVKIGYDETADTAATLRRAWPTDKSGQAAAGRAGNWIR